MLRIEHLALKCTLIRYDLDTFRGRLTGAEDCIGSLEDLKGSHSTQLAELQSQVSSLVPKVEDAENHQRCNNIMVVGLPEGAQGPKVAMFAEAFFKKLLYD